MQFRGESNSAGWSTVVTMRSWLILSCDLDNRREAEIHNLEGTSDHSQMARPWEGCREWRRKMKAQIGSGVRVTPNHSTINYSFLDSTSTLWDPGTGHRDNCREPEVLPRKYRNVWQVYTKREGNNCFLETVDNIITILRLIEKARMSMNSGLCDVKTSKISHMMAFLNWVIQSIAKPADLDKSDVLLRIILNDTTGAWRPRTAGN